jgi:2-polyprenyl-3-methyl-5-hydroxy-6-metoxy-1,4-benzoquinol methylase/uncharacterized protein YbaR (Trm112 family)
MNYHGIELVCPACRSDLEGAADVDGSVRCRSCAREYPVIAGIPDLRLWPDPYIDFEADRAKGLRLHEACATRSFAESVRYYYSVTEAVPPFQARRFERGLLAAEDRARASLDEWQSFAPSAKNADVLLDLGCGTGPLLAVAAARSRQVVGVDVAFRWLVLARRRLAERGVHVPVVCACAEALPFAGASFDCVTAESVLEHLRDGEQAMREVNRVMRLGGWCFLSTPNRFSVGPDPHTGMPAGSWMPDSVVAAYVRRKGGIPPKRRLQSRGSLKRLLVGAGMEVRALFPPAISAMQVAALSRPARLLAGAHNSARRTSAGRAVLQTIGPLLHAVAQKSRDVTSRVAATDPNDASRFGSTSSAGPLPSG